jgi:DNA-binding NarL/FixJ family response regulator
VNASFAARLMRWRRWPILRRLKIVSCDDHDLFRAGLGQALTRVDAEAELLEAGSAKELFDLVGEHDDLDLLLLDHGLPDGNGLDLLTRFRERFPAVPVVMVSGTEEPELVRAVLDRGASGFIPKSSPRDVLVQALQLVLAGGIYVPPLALQGTETHAGVGTPEREARQQRVASRLTARQQETLQLLAKGLTNREIAGVLGISFTTVKGHVSAIFEALEVSNRTEAVMAMVEMGLAEADGER